MCHTAKLVSIIYLNKFLTFLKINAITKQETPALIKSGKTQSHLLASAVLIIGTVNS